MKKVINNIRFFIFLCLVFLIMIVILFGIYFPGEKIIVENIVITLFGVMIMVFLVDFLIRYDRYTKFKLINKITNDYIIFELRRSMIQIMIAFNFINKRNIDFDKIDKAEVFFKKFLLSQKLIDKIEQLKKLEYTNVIFIKKIRKIVENNVNNISNHLEKIKPYPDPSISIELNKNIQYKIGYSFVSVDILNFFLKELPKKIQKVEIKTMKPGMEIIWKKILGGLDEKDKGLENFLPDYFNYLITLLEKAKQSKLFYDI